MKIKFLSTLGAALIAMQSAQTPNAPELITAQYVEPREIIYPTYSKEELEQIVIGAALEHAVPPKLALAFVEHESGWNWLAANNKTTRENSLGLFQINYSYHWQRCDVESAEEMKLPHVNAACGVTYIKEAMEKVDAVFMPYNQAKNNSINLNWYVRLVGCGYNASPKYIQKRKGDVLCTVAAASNYGRALARKFNNVRGKASA